MTTPNDTPEPSLASAGSRCEPVAWALMQPDSYSVFASRVIAEKMQELCAGGEIVPLYSQPQPTLNDAEREAVGWAVSRATYESMTLVASRDAYRRSCALRGVLERLG
jgi:hypothetical protein